jgi:hypothetical protein
MSKNLIAPKGYDEPDAKAEERDPLSTRCLAWGMIAFWACVLGGIALLYACNAHAATQVYLEDEQDLSNGYKLCIYSEGVTITVASHRLCPLSITVGD